MKYGIKLLAAGFLLIAATSIGQAAAPARTAIEIRKAVMASLAAEATAKTTDERVAAIRALAALFKEIASHATLAPSAAQDFQARIAARLERARREIKEHQAKAHNPAKALDQMKPVASVAVSDKPVLGQFPGGNGANVPAADNADGAEELADLIQEIIEPGAWDRNGGAGAIRVFGQIGGGEQDVLGQVAAGGGNRPGAPLQLTENVGEELVTLIQEVIAPQTWDVNGGPGVAVFVPGKNLLVIRQTEEVHEAILDVVGKIRRE